MKAVAKYWKDIWNDQSWSQPEAYSIAADLALTFLDSSPHFLSACGDDDVRPSDATFHKQVFGSRGAGGLDGWQCDELRTLPSAALHEMWDTMQDWETYTLVPSCLLDIRVAMIPKPHKVIDACIALCDLRPVSILPVPWRIWSRTWLQSMALQEWMAHYLPPWVGGVPSSAGTEILAALLDGLILRHGFGASFDFKHAFDMEIGRAHV